MALGSPQCHAAVPRDSHIACVSLTVAKQGPPASRPVAKMAGELWVSIETWAVVAFVDITYTSHPPKKRCRKVNPHRKNEHSRFGIFFGITYYKFLDGNNWLTWKKFILDASPCLHHSGAVLKHGIKLSVFFGIYMGERVRIYIYNMCVIVCK